jgi:F-type H+-transporting ATPase subunit delta
LPAVVEQFRRMLLDYQNILEGELISAVPLEKKQFEAIKKRLEEMLGQTVVLQPKIQPEIIGGFVVRVEDMVIDNSIRLQLQKLREKLVAR